MEWHSIHQIRGSGRCGSHRRFLTGKLPIIAEDLGFLTDSVKQLLASTGFPGMKVLEFAFDSRDTGSGYLPHCYPNNCVVYTGTHDNDTILGSVQERKEFI